MSGELEAVEACAQVVLDFETTNRIDCSCLGVLLGKLRAWRTAEPALEVRLLHVSPDIQRMLAILRLDRLFVIVEGDRPDRGFNPPPTRP